MNEVSSAPSTNRSMDRIPAPEGNGLGEVAHRPTAALAYAAVIDPILAAVHRRIAQMCIQAGAEVVLDIGSATGVQCRNLDAAGVHATGLDLSEVMIRWARRHSRASIRYVLGSALDLPFAEGSFDAAVLVLALHEHTESERQTMLHEACRVVRAAGTLVLAEYVVPRHPTRDPAWWIVRTIERIAGGSHYAGFVDFVELGGMIGLLQRSDLTATEEQRLCGGAIGAVRIPIHHRVT